MNLILLLLLFYLIGSVSFSYLIAKGIRNIDIREAGTGNAGARNVARILGAKYGFLVGFLDILKEKYSEIEVVSSNQYGGVTTESAYVASENLLAPLRRPDGGLTIDGIFCPNEATTFGMLRALEDSVLAGKVDYVGFDSSDRLVKTLRKGYIKGLVLQDPINMDYLGVKTIVAHLRGQKVDKRIDTGSLVATPKNMDEPKVKNLLESDFKKWLNE